MNETKAMQAIETALAAGKNDGMEAAIRGETIGFTRFSNDSITQNSSRSRFTMDIKVSFGKREGKTSTTDFSEDCIRNMVAAAESMARHAPENQEHVGPVPPSDIADTDGFHRRTVDVGPADRAGMVARTLDRCGGTGLSCAGILGNGTLYRAVGNSAGQHAYHRRTWARMNCTVLTDDSSGWRRKTAENIDDIDPDAVFEAALSKAERSRNPVDIEPGRYTVVLESPAVVDLVAFTLWCYQAKLAHQGRSFMTGRLGDQIFDERVSVSTEPGHDGAPGYPFHIDGLPCYPIRFIDRGKAAQLIHDRYWAEKLGGTPTGYPANVIMAGGDKSVDDLVAQVDRGILVSRFWYVRFVEQMELFVTGMTRDGTFLIENGKVTKGVKNMRWNDSVLRAFNAIEDVGRQEREGEWIDALVPSLLVRDFHFTSKTLF